MSYTHTSSGDVDKTLDATRPRERGGEASFRRAMRDFPSGIIHHGENEAVISFHLFYCCSAADETSCCSHVSARIKLRAAYCQSADAPKERAEVSTRKSSLTTTLLRMSLSAGKCRGG